VSYSQQAPMNFAGCVVLHGFTSSLDTVNPLVPHFKAAGIPYDMPLLRGHGTRPEDLEGVKWSDWLEDATEALRRLTDENRPAVLIGLSMGGLLALHLATLFPRRVAGIVSVSTCLRFRDPLVYLSPVIGQVCPYWDVPSRRYKDRAAAATDTNYTRFPMSSFLQLYRYAHVVRAELPRVECPLLILQSAIDETAQPQSATRIYREVGSTDKEVVWYHKTYHELFRDAERDAVMERTMAFVQRVASARAQEVANAVRT
jgi:carboxylesterase